MFVNREKLGNLAIFWTLETGRRHGFSPVRAIFPIYIVHCVLVEFQWGQ